MCGGGGGNSNEEAKQQAEERHQENLALQREQMAEQKRQFEVTRAENKERYERQQRIADADPPPPPEETAGVAAPAIDQLAISGAGRKSLRATPKTKAKKETRKRQTSSLGIVGPLKY